eukprot:1041603-Prymnesium_polylepis.1
MAVLADAAWTAASIDAYAFEGDEPSFVSAPLVPRRRRRRQRWRRRTARNARVADALVKARLLAVLARNPRGGRAPGLNAAPRRACEALIHHVGIANVGARSACTAGHASAGSAGADRGGERKPGHRSCLRGLAPSTDSFGAAPCPERKVKPKLGRD